MPITTQASSPTQNNPFQSLAASMTNPSVGGGLNFQSLTTNPMNVSAGQANPQGVLDILSQHPSQSLTDLMGPLFQQLLSTQGGALQSAYGQQASTGMAQAISDAQKRGLTGSSIEESGIQGALGQAGQGYQQAYANLLGNVVGQYGQAAQSDIGNQNQYYQNIAQALGQDYAQQIQQQQFQQQLSAAMQQAHMMANAQMWSGAFQGLGSIGGGLSAGFSDRRLKEKVVQVGKWMGFNLYAFLYRRDKEIDLPWGLQIGLMAHDVHDKHPDCVGIDRGYLTINYKKLGEIYA